MPRDFKQAAVEQLTAKNIRTIAEVERASESRRTFGERLADRFAAIVGSWTFIVIQSVLLAIWVALNLIAWAYRWDPYPFILLNLALSFQAAYASPIIMMSQNRQSQLADRRNRLDLQINMLSEQENTEMLRLLRKLCEANGINISDEACEALEQEVSADHVLKQIETAEKKANSDKHKKAKS
jgi:uncharacterized membrane protein